MLLFSNIHKKGPNMPLLIEVKVVPLSGRQECTLGDDNVLKCFLKSAPEKGKANYELIKLFSKTLKIPQHFVKIVSGGMARKKRIKIETEMTLEEFTCKITGGGG